MIHRDNRRAYESASGFGQIVSRDAPRDFTAGDVDLYVRTWLGDQTLLRLLEHKQPAQAIKAQQARVLHDLDALIAHAIECPNAPLRLHPESGVWLVQGQIVARTSGRRATEFGGPQRVWNRRYGWRELSTAAEVFTWMARAA